MTLKDLSMVNIGLYFNGFKSELAVSEFSGAY